jgi:L-asparaginase
VSEKRVAGTSRPPIAVLSGPTATIQNTQPLVPSNLARRKYGLPLIAGDAGQLRRSPQAFSIAW